MSTAPAAGGRRRRSPALSCKHSRRFTWRAVILGTTSKRRRQREKCCRRGTFLIRPRSFVVVGTLNHLTGCGGGVLPDRFRSFELFRRNLHEPEIVTFDELVARAEWHVESAAQDSADVASDGRQPDDPW